MDKKTVSLVLSSGGARGLTHIGAIEALLESGFVIGSVAGTSMGALVGGVYASGNLPAFKEFITSLNKVDVLRLMDLSINKKGIIKGEKVFTEMKKFVADINIEDLPIPYTAIATDLTFHREVIFNHGCLLDAIRASVAVPTVLLPFNHEQSILVDGGIVNPLPLNRVNRRAGDLLVAINVNAPRTTALLTDKSKEKKSYKKLLNLVNRNWNNLLHEKPKRTIDAGFFDILSGSIEMMQHKLTEYALHEMKPDMMVNIPVNSADMFEFYKADELIKAGYEKMTEELKNFENHKPMASHMVEEWHI